MMDVVPFLLVVVVGLLAATLTTGPPAQRAFGIATGSLALGAPWLLPASHMLTRGILAIFLAVGLFRVIDLRRGAWSLGDRLRHVLSVVDSRRLGRASPRIEVTTLVRVVAWETLAALSYWLVTRIAPAAPGVWHWAIRWGGGLAFVYTLSEGAYLLLFAGHRALGLTTPPLHDHPAAARSVQEFWGRRWNRVVSSWLGDNLFRPLARRRRPVLGVCLAFVGSGILHAYIAYAAVDFAMALWMLGFFLLQALLVLIEGAAGTTKWRSLPSRFWTLAWMAGASPMFTEPMLRAMGV